jgi:hypothetical protein
MMSINLALPQACANSALKSVYITMESLITPENTWLKPERPLYSFTHKVEDADSRIASEFSFKLEQ